MEIKFKDLFYMDDDEDNVFPEKIKVKDCLSLKL